MNKLIIASVLMATCVAGVANAKVLTPDQALHRASESSIPAMQKAKASENPQLVKTIDADNEPALYVFNRANDAGYLVLAADDAVETCVLGYADNGTIDVQNMPDALAYWLDCLAGEAAYQAKKTQNKSGGIYMANEQNRQAIAPLCKTKWNQNAPFNNDCPMDGSSRSVTGCVATAMAQVLKYYNYPDVGRNVASYTWKNSAGTSTKLSFDFAKKPFDWGNMLDVYTESATDVQKAAVANLMYGCGVSVDMGYTSQESGTASLYIPEALITYFKYDKSLVQLQRGYYTAAEWEDMVYNNLANYGPVLWSGLGDMGGHQFVCDGYDGNGYYHFNWGWGGMSDGYYKLSSLNPDMQGIGGSGGGFDFGQDIVLGMKPEVANSQVVPMFRCPNGISLTASGSVFTMASLNSGGFYSYSSGTVTNLCPSIKFVDAAGNVRYVDHGQTYSSCPSLSGYGAYGATALPALADGTYRATPAVKVDGKYYDVAVPYGKTASYNVKAASGKYTLTANTPSALSISNISLLTPLCVGTPYKMEITFNNANDFELSDGVSMYIGTLSGSTFTSIAAGLEAPVVVEPNGKTTITYESKFYALNNASSTLKAGSYVIVFVNDAGSIIDGKAYNVTIQAAPTSSITASSLVVTPSHSDGQHQLSATATVRMSSGTYFAKQLPMYIFPDTYGSSISSVGVLVSPMIYLTASGQSQQIKIQGAFPAGEDGAKYFASLHDGTNFIGNQANFTLTIPSGVNDVVAADSEIVSTEYISMDGIVYDNDNLSAGVYVKRTVDANGNVKTQRVLIR